MRDQRIVVVFTEQEVQMLDAAVAALNRVPGRRATRSDVVRIGTIKFTSQIADDMARKALEQKMEEAR
jgi:hypothetical protein